MKKTIATVTAVGAFALYVFTAPASAGEFYFGASVGQSKIDVGNCDDLDDGSLVSCSIDDSDIGYKLYGGYHFNPHIAVEGGYVDLGEVKATANSDGSGPVWLAGALEAKGEAKGFLLQGVFGGNVHEKVALFASAGLLFASTDVEVSNGGFAASESASDPETKFGVGAKIGINDRFSLRGEWERFMDVGDDNTGEGDVDLLSAGIEYKIQ